MKSSVLLQLQVSFLFLFFLLEKPLITFEIFFSSFFFFFLFFGGEGEGEGRGDVYNPSKI